MSFTSTHKQAINAALQRWFVDDVAVEDMPEDMRAGYCSDLEAAIRVYMDTRGARVVPSAPTESMVIAGVHHENMGDMEGRYCSMLSASPDPFTDEVRS